MLHHACSQQMQSLLTNYQAVAMHYRLHTNEKSSGHFPSATYLSVLGYPECWQILVQQVGNRL